MPPSAELVADKEYDSNDLRSWLAERGTRAIIAPKRHRKDKLDFDTTIYKQRNIIERMFCRFKHWRRVATRYDPQHHNLHGNNRHCRYRHLVALMSPDPNLISTRKSSRAARQDRASSA